MMASRTTGTVITNYPTTRTTIIDVIVPLTTSFGYNEHSAITSNFSFLVVSGTDCTLKYFSLLIMLLGL